MSTGTLSVQVGKRRTWSNNPLKCHRQNKHLS